MPLQLSANSALQISERTFTELISSIEKKRTAMTTIIRTQERADLNRVSDFFKQVSEEIAMLRQKYTELELLVRTTDQAHFLEVCVSVDFKAVMWCVLDENIQLFSWYL